MPRLFISRLLETFFRRKWLYVLPVVLVLALGVFLVAGTGTSYRSTGVIRVSRGTILGNANGNGNNNQFGSETPAVVTSREINTVLGTDDFVTRVIKGANLTDAVDNGTISVDQVRHSIWAAADGDELVTINAKTADAQLSHALAASAIDSYRQLKIDNTNAESTTAAATIQTTKVDPAQEALNKAQSAMEEFNRTHQLLIGAVRPAADQTAFDALQARLSKAQTDLTNVGNQLDQVTAAGSQSEASVNQQYSTVDKPAVPAGPEPHRKQDVITLVMFFFLGLLAAAATLVVATLADRSVRYGEEIETRLHVPVLGSIPDSPAALKPRVL